MHEPDFWTHCAESMEMSIEGNRLIAQEIADTAKTLWRRFVDSFDGVIDGLGQHPHLPPM